MDTPTAETAWNIDGRLWICLGNKVQIGKGKIELLEKTGHLGSLRKAAAEMKMSYRQAWQEIHQINQHPSGPAVILHRGGALGGQATLTPFGKWLIDSYHQVEIAFKVFKTEQKKKLRFP